MCFKSTKCRNQVSDPIQIEYLVFCTNLKSLTLLDNPIDYDSVLQETETTADVQIRNRHIVSTLIPQLEILDDIPLGNMIKPKEEIKECETIKQIDEILEKPLVEQVIIKRPKSVATIKRPTPPSKFDLINESIINYKHKTNINIAS